MKPTKQQEALAHYREHGGVFQFCSVGIYCWCGHFSAFTMHRMYDREAFDKFLKKHGDPFSKQDINRILDRSTKQFLRAKRVATKAIELNRFAIATRNVERAERLRKNHLETLEGKRRFFHLK